MKHSLSRITALLTLGLLLIMPQVGCSTSEARPVVFYRTAYRQSPPAPVYSRVMWSQLPEPIPPRASDNAPYLLPEISFIQPDSTLEEAIEALAQTMGYRWQFPPEVAKRPIRIKMDGTVEEVLAEIGKQAGLETQLDHESRMVRVLKSGVIPRLPSH